MKVEFCCKHMADAIYDEYMELGNEDIRMPHRKNEGRCGQWMIIDKCPFCGADVSVTIKTPDKLEDDIKNLYRVMRSLKYKDIDCHIIGSLEELIYELENEKNE